MGKEDRNDTTIKVAMKVQEILLAEKLSVVEVLKVLFFLLSEVSIFYISKREDSRDMVIEALRNDIEEVIDRIVSLTPGKAIEAEQEETLKRYIITEYYGTEEEGWTRTHLLTTDQNMEPIRDSLKICAPEARLEVLRLKLDNEVPTLIDLPENPRQITIEEVKE